jgi:hypothetical protein
MSTGGLVTSEKHDGKKRYHPAPLPITIADGQRG